MSVGSDLAALSLARKLALVGGVGLFIVLFFPWVGVDFGDLGDLVDLDNFTDNGWDGVGVLAGVFAIALVAWELIRLFGQAPKLNVSPDYVTAGLAALAALFGLIQFFRALTYGGDLEDDFESLGIEGPNAGPRFGAFLGLLFVLVLAYAAFLAFQSGSRRPVAPGDEEPAAGESPWPPPADAGTGGAAAGGAAAGGAAAGEPAADPYTEGVSADPAAAPDATNPLDAVNDEPGKQDTPPTDR